MGFELPNPSLPQAVKPEYFSPKVNYVLGRLVGGAHTTHKHTFWLCKPNIVPIHPPLRDRKIASSYLYEKKGGFGWILSLN